VAARKHEVVARFFYEMGQLKRAERTGWWIAGVKHPETVAEHSFRVALIGYVLAQMEGADAPRTAAICLFHDLPECRLNDLHRVARRYVNLESAEARAFSEQIGGLPQSLLNDLASLMSDFLADQSPEARLDRDADALECLIQAREYQAQGFVGVADWAEPSAASLVSKTARALAEACLQMEPSEWWQGLKVRASRSDVGRAGPATSS